MPSQKLKCPNCRGKGKVIRTDSRLWHIHCDDCGMWGPAGESEAQAWFFWNQLSRVPVRYLDIQKAAEYLDISISLLRKRQHDIEHARFGEDGKRGKVVFRIEDLDRFFKENRV